MDWLSDSSNKFIEQCLEHLFKLNRSNFRNPLNSTLIETILTDRPHKYHASVVFALDIDDNCPGTCVRDTMIPKINLK